jgi:hypothetical protein
MSRFAPYILLFVATVAPVAETQSVSTVKPEGRKHAAGNYQGVIPGSGNPPAVKFAPGCVPTRATWLGFQPLQEGGSRFFLQVTSPIEIQIEDPGADRFVVILKNVRVAGRNNRRPLETSLFNTPVKRAYLRHHKKDTKLIFELRTNAIPVITNQPGKGGFHFVLFDFPAGEFIPASKDPLLPQQGSPE